MTTPADLFLAILALDSYNRGYGPGMTFAGNSDDRGTEIGDATVLVATDDRPSQNASFYAIAYNWEGEDVIAYRGTRFPGFPDLGDMLNGWTLSLGFSQASQPQLALDFYTNVQLHFAGGVNGQPIELTGHSLGGGLSGFVADLTGSRADIFNNIAFGTGVVAQILSEDRAEGMTIPAFVFLGKNPFTGTKYETLPSSSANVRQFITSGELATGTVPTSLAAAASDLAFVAQGIDPVTAAALVARGLILDHTVVSQTLDPHVSAASSTDLHSQSLMVLLLYANLNNETDWTSVGQSLYGALFNNNIANATGFAKVADEWYTPSARLMAGIAYSALDSGAMPFGDTAIESLFNDADTLGGIQSAGQFTGLLTALNVLSPPLGGSSVMATASTVGALAEIAVQFAAQQAHDANAAFLDESATPDPALADGAFTSDGSTLKVDLTPQKWLGSFQLAEQQSNKNTPAVLGLGDFFDAVLQNISNRLTPGDPTYSWIQNNLAGFSTPLLKQLNEITQIDVALSGGDLSTTGLPAARDGNPGGVMLVGGDGQGSLTGTDKGKDIIIGGSTVKTGDGDDIILVGGTETVTVGKGNNKILTDSNSGNNNALNLTLTYAGATGGAAGGASAGSDLIIGNAQGGDTFTFNDANKAAFTVVWGGTGNDTYDFNAASSAYVNVLLLNMNGVTADNITSLDMAKFESYVDTNYASESIQGYGGPVIGPAPTIVVLNPTSTDKLEYNGVALSSPQVTSSSSGGPVTSPGVRGFDYTNDFAAANGLPSSQLQLLGTATEDIVTHQTGSLTVFGPPVTNYDGLPVNGNAWQIETLSGGISNSLSRNGIGYSYASQTYGPNQSPIATLGAGASGGSGGLNVINFAPNEFGINLNAGVGVPRATETETVTDYAVTAWRQVFFDSLARQLPSIEGQFLGFVPDPSFTGTYFGVQPAALGAVISTSSATFSGGGNLIDPGTLPTVPAVDINAYLTNTDSGGSSGGGSNGNSGGNSNGNSPPGFTEVSAAFFAANQPALDGQFAGFTVRDTATNVSSAFDALNDDSKLTGITLTDSGTPTLTLAVAQASGDATALSEITNASYDIAIVDTAANVSQNFDALNADLAVSSITLTDAATGSLTLTAVQALADPVALGRITNAGYTIAVSDAAANISSAIDALNNDTAVTSVTLTDSGTPALTLTVAQALGDTVILGEITNADYAITIEDTAANILASASALSADTHVTGAVVVDSAANVLDNAAALSADTLVTSITVVDSVANIFANLSALQSDTQVTSLVVADTAANILGNAAALAAVSDITAIGVVDSAADVSANIDALNADASISSIMLTDSGIPTLTLTVAQAVNDTTTLVEIANPTYAIDVVDTAVDVAANIDALSQVAALAQITLTDTGTPTLTVTAAQAVNDAAVIAIVTNPDAQIVVSDTATDVSAAFDALNADGAITGIVLTDAGTPVLTLTAAQALGDTTAFGKIAGANYSIALSDTAADVSAAIDALNADGKVGSIALTDNGTPTLGLSAAQILADTAALGEITNANYQIVVYDSAGNILADTAPFAANPHFATATVVDSAANVLARETDILADPQVGAVIVADAAANVSANIDALNANPELSAIVLTDSGVPTLTLTVAQALDDGRAIDSIANRNWSIAISDTAANVAANIDVLNSDAAIASISLTDSGTPALQLSVGQAVADSEALFKIANQNYNINIVGSAADVVANIDALEALTHLGSISLTGLPALALTASQVAADADVLAKITSNYAISVTDSAANVLTYQNALSETPHITSLAVVDTAANILANAAALQADTQITSLTVVDDVADVLADSADLGNIGGLRIQVADTAANILANTTALGAIPQISSTTVVDSAADIGANLVQLAGDFRISAIQFTDSGTPVVPLSASALISSAFFLFRSEEEYTIGIVDTAANVSAHIDQFFGWPITSITLTDSGTPTLTLSVDQLFSDGSLSEITNPAYGVSIIDTAANVTAEIDGLAAFTHLSSITLTDGGIPTLTLSVAQALNDTAALSKIAGDYTIAVADTAANILANAADLQSDSSVSSIRVMDSVANIFANASALAADPQITNVTVVDSAANVLANSSALAASPLISEIDVADSAAVVSVNADALNNLSKLSAITLTDGGPLALTVDQTLNDTNVFDAISSPFSIDVADTAANIVQHLADLTTNSHVALLAVVDTFANYLANESAFANITLPVQFGPLDLPPAVTITSAAEVSSVAVQTITGTVVPVGAATVVGQTVTLLDNGAPLGTTTVAADGTFTASVTLSNVGANTIVATVTDSLGHTGISAPVVDTLGALTPILSNIAASVQFTEGHAAVKLAGTVTVLDTHSATLASATVVVTGGTFAGDGDVLTASTTGTSITASYNATAETLTLSGTDTLAHYQKALRSVRFSSAGDNPDDYGSNPTRTVTWLLNDGAPSNNLSPPQIETVGITAVNDPPTLTNVAANVAFTEAGAAVTLSPSATVSDPDNLILAGATISITSGNFTGDGDLLSANTAGTSITASYDAAGETLTLTGTDALADYQQVLNSVTFSTTSQNPDDYGLKPTRTVTWVLNDGSGSSTSQTETLSVTAINNPPALGNIAASVQFTEAHAAVKLSNAVTVADPDNQTLAAATIAVTGGSFAGDGDVLAANTIGTSITASYDSTAETLTLSGTDTLAHYQKALRSVTFSSTSDNPDDYGSNPTRTVTWLLNDGSASNNLSMAQTETVNLTAVNDPPTLTNVASASAFTEAGAAVTLSPGVTVSDPDNLMLAGATVSIASGNFTGDGDLLSANTAGTSITASYDTVGETLTLAGGDTLADYQQVLDSVTFSSTSQNPDDYGSKPTRTITWALNDGSASSSKSTETVSVAAVNNAPTLSNVAASAQYTAGRSAVKLSNAVTVTDPDNQNLTGATVAIAGGTFAGDGDVLAAVTTNTIITASYNSTTEILVLSGSDTLAHYQKVLRSVTFNSTSADPTNAGVDPTRAVSWVLDDGSASNNLSTTATTTVAIPPVLTIGNPSITVSAGSSIALPVTVSPSGSAVTVNITGLVSYETITDHNDTTVFSGNSVTLTAAEVNSGLMLNSSYTGTGHPVNTLTVTANDTANGQTSSSAPQTITVTDPPLTTTSSTDVVSTDPSASAPSVPTSHTSTPDVDPNPVAASDPAPVLWQSHDTGPITVLAGTALETHITWDGGSSPFGIGDITSGAAVPGTMLGGFNVAGAGFPPSAPMVSASGMLWNDTETLTPIAGAWNNPLGGIAQPGDPTAASLAGGGLMPAAWTSTLQHPAFGAA